MIKYTVGELLQALKIEDNPQAVEQFVMLMGIITLFVVTAIFFKNFPLILKKKMDNDLYNFLKEFKELNSDEILFLEKIIKKHKIKSKYELFILESVFDKYTEREIISIETSYAPMIKKQEEILKIQEIRTKIFGNRNV